MTGLSKEQECLNYVQAHAKKGDPESVLNAIDEFCSKNWMMNVGDVKGQIVEKQIQKHKPKVIVEIGGYCGYSAVRFAHLQRQLDPDAKYYSFEFSPEYANIAAQVISFAGLSNYVTIKVGPFDQNFLKSGLRQVDMFFIDHAKELYLPDVKLIIDSGTLKKGSVIVADNIVYPGAPDYKKFMQNHSQFKSELVDTYLEYSEDQKDAIMFSEYLG